MKLSLILLLFVNFVSFAYGRGLLTTKNRARPENLLVNSCTNTLSSFNWGAKSGKRGPSCTYAPYFGSLAICIHEHSDSDSEIRKAVSILASSCSNLTYEKLEKAYNNATKYAIDEDDLKSSKTKLYTPIIGNSNTYNTYHYAIRNFYINYDRSVDYGLAILAYWAGVMILGAVGVFLERTGLTLLCKDRVSKFFQSSIFIPSLFNGKHTQVSYYFTIISSLIPTRAESLILFGYVLVHVIVLSINWQFGEEGVYFASRGMELMRYLADRTGIIAFAHFPLIFLFAGRNNFLQWLTGFSFSTFIQFHKWTGRIMFVDAALHSILYTVMHVESGRYKNSLKREYFQYGIVATVACGVLMIQSYNWFRRHGYEIFLYVHIVIAALFLAGVYKHCEELGYMEFVFTSMAVWCIDRLVRIIRMAMFGFRKANIKVVSEETMRVSVKRPSGSRWHAKPGQFVYIYFFKGSKFYQSHPFTVNDSTIKDEEINIYVKAKSGVTKQIYDMVSKKPGKVDNTITVSIEGPYGHSAPNFHYDNIVLFAGGNGIPGPFDHALKLAKRFAEGQKTIKLVWVARDLASINWFASELSLLKGSVVDVCLYLTRESPSSLALGAAFCDAAHSVSNTSESGSNETEKEKSTDQEKVQEYAANATIVAVDEKAVSVAQQFEGFNISCGRPDTAEMIRKLFSEQKGSIAITACGPNVLCDLIRNSIAEYVEDHDGRVDYFEELQTW